MQAIQNSLQLFASDLKVGYNSGEYGWNYDLYKIAGYSVVTGYRVPYKKYCDKEIKRKLIAFENKLRVMDWIEKEVNMENLRFEFFECFR